MLQEHEPKSLSMPEAHHGTPAREQEFAKFRQEKEEQDRSASCRVQSHDRPGRFSSAHSLLFDTLQIDHSADIMLCQFIHYSDLFCISCSVYNAWPNI